jgi:hypothetical protein
MSEVIVVDTREQFAAEVAAYLQSKKIDVQQITDPRQLRRCTPKLHDTVVALWAECPDQAGIQVPRTMMRAIAVSRRPIPVVLYASRRESLTGLLEPGMQYPTLVVSAHACSVAGVVQRVVRQVRSSQDKARAFEDWAHANQVSLAGLPGRVSVFTGDGNGGFTVLGDPQDPLTAVGCLLDPSAHVNLAEHSFY